MAHHIVMFPFLSKGHTIPLLHLAHLLHRRGLAAVTFITTPRNAPFIRTSLAGLDSANIIEIPFPENSAGVPPGVESTDQLPSFSGHFIPFLFATPLLKPDFERALSGLADVSLLISDGFYPWTTESASRFQIPRLFFWGMGGFAFTVMTIITTHLPHAGIDSDDEPFPVAGLPGLTLTRADLNPPHNDPASIRHFAASQAAAELGSRGTVFNTFYELEAPYVDHWNEHLGPRGWCVGPLCLARPETELPRNELTEWLDSRSAMNRPVLYVAFGTQAELSAEQLREIATGLERSELDFLWVVRGGIEEGSKGRGRIVKEWVDQLGILRHRSVRGFVSHCGWNSVLESVCAGVPILAWPMMAEQHLNAKFVVEELGIGLRVRARDGTKHGIVKGEDIAELAKELVMGERGKVAAERVERLAAKAEEAMMDGGSSVTALEQLIEEVARKEKPLTIVQN